MSACEKCDADKDHVQRTLGGDNFVADQCVHEMAKS